MNHRQVFGNYVKEQLRKWGLEQQGWGYCYAENWRNRLGRCLYGHKTLQFSLPFIDNNPFESLVDTVHHEIGHALAGPGAKHGESWKALAPIVGYIPRACSIEKLNIPSKYTAACSCGSVFKRNRKKPGAIYLCGRCQSPLTWMEVE